MRRGEGHPMGVVISDSLFSKAGNGLYTVTEDDVSKLKHEHERACALLRVTQTASSSLVVDEVLQSIADEIVNATGANLNAFLFPDRAKYGNYYFVNPLPPSDYKVPDPPDALSLEALHTNKPVIARDAMSDPRTDKRTMEYFGVKSAMAFPLLFQGKAVAAGFLSTPYDREFSSEEIEWVMALAGAGAMAVVNAQLHESQMRLAMAHERNRIARDMHDGLSQLLAAIKMNLNALLLNPKLNKQVRRSIVGSKELVDEAYGEVKETIYGSMFLGNMGMLDYASFLGYVEQFAERNGLDVEIDIEESDLGLLNSEASIQASCIINEALTNVRKHARASRVLIREFADESIVVFSVEDDGVGMGFGAQSGETGMGVGMSIMKERADFIGGRLDVLPSSLGGVCVRLAVPYR